MSGAVGFEADLAAMLPDLRRWALRLARNAADAEDLVQDTLIRAWLGRDTFEPGSHFPGWLYRVMRNRWVAICRRASAGKRAGAVGALPLHDLLPSEMPPARTCSPDVGVRMRDLGAAIRSLTPKQRDALRVYVRAGNEFHGPAAALGISPSTLKSNVFRAWAAMATEIDR